MHLYLLVVFLHIYHTLICIYIHVYILEIVLQS